VSAFLSSLSCLLPPAFPPYFSEKSALPPDKSCVSRFLDDAEEILKTAEAASGATQNPTNFTILIGREGHIHMLADSDWPLASLDAHHGHSNHLPRQPAERRGGRRRPLGLAALPLASRKSSTCCTTALGRSYLLFGPLA